MTLHAASCAYIGTFVKPARDHKQWQHFPMLLRLHQIFFFLSLAIPTKMEPSFYHLLTKLDDFLAGKKYIHIYILCYSLEMELKLTRQSGFFCFFFTDTNFWHSDFIQLLKLNPVTRDTLYNWQVTYFFFVASITPCHPEQKAILTIPETFSFIVICFFMKFFIFCIL